MPLELRKRRRSGSRKINCHAYALRSKSRDTHTPEGNVDAGGSEQTHCNLQKCSLQSVDGVSSNTQSHINRTAKIVIVPKQDHEQGPMPVLCNEIVHQKNDVASSTIAAPLETPVQVPLKIKALRSTNTVHFGRSVFARARRRKLLKSRNSYRRKWFKWMDSLRQRSCVSSLRNNPQSVFSQQPLVKCLKNEKKQLMDSGALQQTGSSASQSSPPLSSTPSDNHSTVAVPVELDADMIGLGDLDAFAPEKFRELVNYSSAEIAEYLEGGCLLNMTDQQSDDVLTKDAEENMVNRDSLMFPFTDPDPGGRSYVPPKADIDANRRMSEPSTCTNYYPITNCFPRTPSTSVYGQMDTCSSMAQYTTTSNECNRTTSTQAQPHQNRENNFNGNWNTNEYASMDPLSTVPYYGDRDCAFNSSTPTGLVSVVTPVPVPLTVIVLQTPQTAVNTIQFQSPCPSTTEISSPSVMRNYPEGPGTAEAVVHAMGSIVSKSDPVAGAVSLIQLPEAVSTDRLHLLFNKQDSTNIYNNHPIEALPRLESPPLSSSEEVSVDNQDMAPKASSTALQTDSRNLNVSTLSDGYLENDIYSSSHLEHNENVNAEVDVTNDCTHPTTADSSPKSLPIVGDSRPQPMPRAILLNQKPINRPQTTYEYCTLPTSAGSSPKSLPIVGDSQPQPMPRASLLDQNPINRSQSTCEEPFTRKSARPSSLRQNLSITEPDGTLILNKPPAKRLKKDEIELDDDVIVVDFIQNLEPTGTAHNRLPGTSNDSKSEAMAFLNYVAALSFSNNCEAVPNVSRYELVDRFCNVPKGSYRNRIEFIKYCFRRLIRSSYPHVSVPSNISSSSDCEFLTESNLKYLKAQFHLRFLDRSSLLSSLPSSMSMNGGDRMVLFDEAVFRNLVEDVKIPVDANVLQSLANAMKLSIGEVAVEMNEWMKRTNGCKGSHSHLKLLDDDCQIPFFKPEHAHCDLCNVTLSLTDHGVNSHLVGEHLQRMMNFSLPKPVDVIELD